MATEAAARETSDAQLLALASGIEPKLMGELTAVHGDLQARIDGESAARSATLDELRGALEREIEERARIGMFICTCGKGG